MSKYHKGDKFIVEIKEVINSDNGTLYRSDFKTLTFDDNGLDKLQKYEQPTISEDTLEMERMKALNDGRNEVWELTKKLWYLGIYKCKEIFGYGFTIDIIEHFTPQEVLLKLEEYEKEQNEIKVGGVVCANNYPNYEFVVCYIHISEIGGYATYGGITEKGTWFANDDVKKTGKHIDIQSLLEQIKE